MIGLRLAFLLVLMGVGFGLASDEQRLTGRLAQHRDLIVISFLGAGLIVISLDIFIPRKSLGAISGVFFGLVVGMVVAYGLSLILNLVVEANPGGLESDDPVTSALKLALGVVCCYLAVSFILQTKDDIRFVIPYVEFSRESKGGRPLVLDTSVVVDGRIADIAATNIFDSELVVPRFVLQELQTIADSSDKLKRNRGRRGLDMLNKLQSSDIVDIRILEVKPERSAGDAGVDEMLVDLAKQLEGKIVTNDYNLNKVARLRGVPVININDLAGSLRPVVLPGETMVIKVVKPGEEVGQGVGYLEDGTMVVAEGAREHIGENVTLVVTSVLQTSAGRMIFGRMDGMAPPDRRRPRPGGPNSTSA
ncbi:MAG: PIN domain-containing protein [Phycisphaerae bacterium]|nr:PIN domain-containing protein [Phycisphaerae bacterium]